MVGIYKEGSSFYAEKEGRIVEEVVVEVADNFYNECVEKIREDLSLDVELGNGEVGVDFVKALEIGDSVEDVVKETNNFVNHSGEVRVTVKGMSKEPIPYRLEKDEEADMYDKLNKLKEELGYVSNVISDKGDAIVFNEMLEEDFVADTKAMKGSNIPLASVHAVINEPDRKEKKEISEFLYKFGIVKGFDNFKQYKNEGNTFLKVIEEAIDLHLEQIESEKKEYGSVDEKGEEKTNFLVKTMEEFVKNPSTFDTGLSEEEAKKSASSYQKLLDYMSKVGMYEETTTDHLLTQRGARKRLGEAKRIGTLYSMEEVRKAIKKGTIDEYEREVQEIKKMASKFRSVLRKWETKSKHKLVHIDSTFNIVLLNNKEGVDVAKDWKDKYGDEVENAIGRHLEVTIR